VGEDKRLRIDLLITICAVVIAAIASGASVYQSYVIRQQYDSAVWPYLSFVVSRDPSQASFLEADLRNDGLGPALIRSVIVTANGKPVASVDAAVAPLMREATLSQNHSPHPIRMRGLTSTISAGDVIPAGRSIQLLRADGAPFVERVLAAAPHLNVTICYCSLTQRCWIKGFAEQAAQPHEVRACPVDADPNAAPRAP
jgi:hypothetical protein